MGAEQVLSGQSMCWCNPYTLILGLLNVKPRRRSEIDEIARRLYDNDHSCWSMEDYRIIMGFLLYSGMVVEKDGLLFLDLEDPFDWEYAQLASRECTSLLDIEK